MTIRRLFRSPLLHPYSILALAVLTALQLVPPAPAATTDWANFASSPGYMADYTSEGRIIADEETSADTSHGSAAIPPAWTDLASLSPSAGGMR